MISIYVFRNNKTLWNLLTLKRFTATIYSDGTFVDVVYGRSWKSAWHAANAYSIKHFPGRVTMTGSIKEL